MFVRRFGLQIHYLTVGAIMAITFYKSSKDGKVGNYSYRFMVKKKSYTGVCRGCLTKLEAEAFERDIRGKVEKLATMNSLHGIVAEFKKELVGGNDIKLSDMFALAEGKPSKPSEWRWL